MRKVTMPEWVEGTAWSFLITFACLFLAMGILGLGN